MLVFVATEFSPGTVASKILGPYAVKSQVESLSQRLRLEDPLPLRYGRWLGALLGGGFVNAVRASTGTAGATRSKTSCILIWLDGGPSQLESYDPKPDAPPEFRRDGCAVALLWTAAADW